MPLRRSGHPRRASDVNSAISAQRVGT